MLVLVQGSTGALGSALVQSIRKRNWIAIGAGFAPNPDASLNIDLSGASPTEQVSLIRSAINKTYPGSKLGAVLCASGGFAMGNAASADLFEISEKMFSSSVQASLVASQIAASDLSPEGLLVLVGAAAVSGGTPWALAYGAAKAGVHQMVKSLAGTGSGLPKGARVIGVAPVALDTLMNRRDMPKADFTNWTNTAELSDKICDWVDQKKIWESGDILRVLTKNGLTSFERM
jgi:dihydropteridine reductase